MPSSSPHSDALRGWRGFARLCFVAAATLTSLRCAAADATTGAPDPNTLITDYAEYWRDGVRNETRPIRMEVLVTYYDPVWRNFWGLINGQPGFVASRSVFPITHGDRVLIEGKVIPWRGLDADLLTVTVLERNAPVEILDTRGQVKDFARFKERVVTIDALLDKQYLDGTDHVKMELVAEGHRINLFHWSAQPRLLDVPEGTIVRLKGVYNSKHDPRTDKVEIDLWVTHFADIVPIGNTSSDSRFERALMSIGELPRLPFGPNRQARVAGYVREYNPGVGLTLRDDTGQIIVRTLQTLPLQIGDAIEAIGDPFTWGSDWLLRGAIVRRATPETVAHLSRPTAATGSLRIASQVLELSPEEAATERPVEMYGIVTWCSLNADVMVLRDSSGGVLVHLNGAADVPPKMLLGMRLTGVTTRGAYAPEIKATRIEYWGGALLPEARSVTLDQLMSGEFQGARVQIRGHVKRVVSDGSWTQLTLGTATGEFTVKLDRTEEARDLAGSIVSVRGICQGVANPRRQLARVELWTHAFDQIRIEQAAPADPFGVGLRQISALRQFNPNARMHGWVRVRGVVTHHVPGRLLFVQDGTEGILILSPQLDPLAPGDVVDATGLPGLQDQRVVLREALFRKVDHTSQPAPIVVEHPRTITETLESRLVELRGRLINSVIEGEVVTLAIQSEDMVFSALLHRAGAVLNASSLLPGSVLDLTGVYELLRNERDVADSFRLQLRSPRDIIVVQTPSWWTPGRLVFVTVALFAIIAVVSAWSVALRRRVQRQTAQIRTQLVKEANLEAHNRDIVADASDAIFTTDLTGRLTSFNPAGERMTGFAQDEALQMNLRDLVVPDDSAQLAARLDTLHQGEPTVTFQSRFRRRDGGHVWVESSLRLRRESGQPSGILGVVRDVSERKQVEEELRRARDAAEANTQAKSAFLANMSHEIRTPMNAVIGMSNLLLDTRLDAEQREFAGTIRNGAESLLTVLNDILDFSRIEAGKLSFETVDFDLAETIDETLEMLAPRAASKQLELSAYVPPTLPTRLRGDPGRLRQVLLNLLGNAVKFTDHGEVVLTLAVEAQTDTHLQFRVDVRDTGVGMSTETIASLFRPFTQADASMARRFGGTGLGLAISKQIVELQGGQIGANSQPGEGSTFWFTARLERQSTHRDTRATPVAPAGFANVRVLGVDPHLSNRRIIEHYAQAWGMRVATAPDAATALALLQAATTASDPYRVLLTDAHLPDLDGIAFAHRIQDEAGFGRPAMVLLTSVDRRLSPAETAAAGIATVLTKPLRVPELFAGLQRILKLNSDDLLHAREATTNVAASFPHPNLRVLVAEDNITNQRLIALQLAKYGCTVDIANHGIEVLEALERVEYDVVLMDCQMPEMDGLEATRRIRQSGRYGRVRIVAMTANAMSGDRDRCLAAGMDEYLSKPVRPDDLRGVLVRATQASVPTPS